MNRSKKKDKIKIFSKKRKLILIVCGLLLIAGSLSIVVMKSSKEKKRVQTIIWLLTVFLSSLFGQQFLLDKTPFTSIPKVLAQGPGTCSGYVHMAPDDKGFICDDGAPFVPNGFLVNHLWKIRNEDEPRFWIKDNATYDEVLAELSQAGINHLRTNLHFSIGEGKEFGMQTIPLGKYYVAERLPENPTDLIDFDILADPSHPNYEEMVNRINNSNFTELIEAAENHNVKFDIELFGSHTLWKDYIWIKNPYNRNAYYIWGNEERVLREDAGPLDDPLEFFVAPGAIQRDYTGVENPWVERGVTRGDRITNKEDRDYITAYYQKEFIDFVIDTWGDSPAIYAWSIVGESRFLAGLHNGYTREEITELYSPWLFAIKDYIKQKDSHNRIVHFGQLFPRSSTKDLYVLNEDRTTVAYVTGDGTQTTLNYDEIDEYTRFRSLHNYLFRVSDLVQWHHYFDYSLESFSSIARGVQKIYGSKPLYISDFWGSYYKDGYAIPPFDEDKQIIWLNLIAQGGRTTAGRQHTKAQADDTVPTDWRGNLTYLNEPWLHTIYIPTAKFIDLVNWQEWRRQWSRNQAWEDQITSNDLDFVIAQGDGSQVMIMLKGNENNVSLAVNNLSSGNYIVRLIDYLTGNIASSQTLPVSNGRIDLNLNLSDSVLDTNPSLSGTGGYSREQIAIVYMEKEGIQTPNDCEHDLNNNGKIETIDLLVVLQYWSTRTYNDKTWNDSANILMLILEHWGEDMSNC
jgi:hypothetical protein